MLHQSPSVSCMYIKGYLVMYSEAWLRSVRFAVNSEAIQAGVFRMTPVRQHSHLNDLKGLVILLLERKKKGKMKHGQNFIVASFQNPVSNIMKMKLHKWLVWTKCMEDSIYNVFQLIFFFLTSLHSGIVSLMQYMQCWIWPKRKLHIAKLTTISTKNTQIIG